MTKTPTHFDEFWEIYLEAHQNLWCQRLHILGTSLAFLGLIFSFYSLKFLILVPVLGYLPAWLGHFFFEKNTPLTFQYPFWSLKADLKLFSKLLKEQF